MRRLDMVAARTGLYTDVISVSASVSRSCADYPEKLRQRTHVVYNGLKGWQSSPLDQAAARAKLGLATDGVLAVAVGRIDLQKNYPVLIDALARTQKPVRLAIAGDGADRAKIEAQIAGHGLGGRVTLLGKVGRETVPVLLAAGTVFVQPSLFEGQSNALLEALHAGLPCYVSDAPEQIETVVGPDGSVAGAVLPVDDPAAWAHALDDIGDGAVTPELRDVIARQADLFTFARMMASFEAVIG
jgi:glycosyltransferase involved in cell wall biosynthesis